MSMIAHKMPIFFFYSEQCYEASLRPNAVYIFKKLKLHSFKFIFYKWSLSHKQNQIFLGQVVVMLNKHLFSENVEFSVFTGLKCDRSSPLRNIWLVIFHCVNEGEQQLTSALYGRKIAEAKLPVMPLRMYMMEIRSQPASFSRSLRMVIWKATDTRQCKILQEHKGCGQKKKKNHSRVLSGHVNECHTCLGLKKSRLRPINKMEIHRGDAKWGYVRWGHFA